MSEIRVHKAVSGVIVLVSIRHEEVQHYELYRRPPAQRGAAPGTAIFSEESSPASSGQTVQLISAGLLARPLVKAVFRRGVRSCRLAQRAFNLINSRGLLMTWLPERLPSSVASFSRRQLPVCSLITKARMFPVGCREERTGNASPLFDFPPIEKRAVSIEK